MTTALEVQVEAHRGDRHFWVKPGRLAVFDRDVLEMIADEQPNLDPVFVKVPAQSGW